MKRLGYLALGFCVIVTVWLIDPSKAQQSSGVEMPLAIIVAASEPEAQRIIQRLDKGEDFASLAKKDRSIPALPTAGIWGD